MQPKTRTNDELIIRRVGDELVVYDLEQDRGHALNPTAAFIFDQCDGKTTVEQMSRRMATELNIPHSDQVTTMALDRLGRANLLIKPVANNSSTNLSRRELLKLAGKTGLAAAMLPVVTTLLVPSAVQAQSGTKPGKPDECQMCCEKYLDCLNPLSSSTTLTAQELSCEDIYRDCLDKCFGC